MGLVIDTDVWVLAEKSGAGLGLARRAQRGAFVENLLSSIPVLEFSLSVARTHARMIAALPKRVAATAHDALIAATAVHHGYALLTCNVVGFKIFAGLQLEAFNVAA